MHDLETLFLKGMEVENAREAARSEDAFFSRTAFPCPRRNCNLSRSSKSAC
jgi:hypothetical protein